MDSEWDPNEKRNDPRCQICGGSCFRDKEFRNGARLRLCRACGFGETILAPEADSARAIYEDPAVTQRWTRLEEIRRREWERFFPDGLREGRKPGDWHVDVGAGHGDFCLWMTQRGWTSLGMDLTPRFAQRVRERGIPCVVASMLDLPICPGKVSLISFMDTLEHVFDPGKVLRQARDVLRPQGCLLIRCPNASSWSARLLGRFWPWWSLEDHRVHFSPQSLHVLLEQTGFQCVSMRSVEEPSVYTDLAIKAFSRGCHRLGLPRRFDFGLRPLILLPLRLLFFCLRPFQRWLEGTSRAAALVVTGRVQG